LHFVGARFRDLRTASAALGEIRASVDVEPGDLAVRPLGSTRYDVPSDDIVLAGRFEPGDVEAVVEILEAHGGAILARRPESPAGHELAPPTGSDRDARARPAERARPPVKMPRKRLRRQAALLRGLAARDRRIRN
jgi:hypothetical protein